MNRAELLQKQTRLKAELETLLDRVTAEAEAEGRGLAPNVEAAIAGYKAELEELDRQLAEPDEILDAGPYGAQGRAVAADPDDDDLARLSMLPPVPRRTHAAIARMFRDVAPVAHGAAVQAFRDTVVAVLGGSPLHPAVLAATQTEGIPSDGGFAVMPDTARGLIMRAAEASVFLRIGVRFEPMTSEERTIVALDDDDETSDAEAKVSAKWQKEAGAATAQLLKLRQVVLHAHKLMVLAATSSELSEDAGPAFLTELEAGLSRAIGKKLDRSILTGTGAGQPLGLLNAPATVTVTKETSQLAATIMWENVVKMWARLAPGSHENAWWLAHPSTLPQMHLLSVKVKNVAGTENVGGFQPLGAFTAGGPTGYLLLGRPVVITSRCKQLGTAGDLMLVDPLQVVIGMRRLITIDRSIHAYFESDRIAVRGTCRADARPVWDAQRTLVEGTDKVSPYVILEGRS